MWDKDLVKKDYMGEVAVPLGQWFQGSETVVWDEQTQRARAFELVSARRRRRVSGRVFLQFGLVLPDDVPREEREQRARVIVRDLESKGERHMACLMDVPAVSSVARFLGMRDADASRSTKASALSRLNAIARHAPSGPASPAAWRNRKR